MIPRITLIVIISLFALLFTIYTIIDFLWEGKLNDITLVVSMLLWFGSYTFIDATIKYKSIQESLALGQQYEDDCNYEEAYKEYMKIYLKYGDYQDIIERIDRIKEEGLINE